MWTDKKRWIIIDIDGTIAEKWDRYPYDWHSVGEDDPKEIIIKIIRASIDSFWAYPIVVSGRDESCRRQTELWLQTHFAGEYTLYMRPEGDNRADDLIKKEIYDTHIRSEFDIICVFDDRDRVVKMWREIWLICLQVASGDF